MKKVVPIARATRLINPGPVVLVTARYKDRVNAMPAAWVVPLSINPPLVGVALQHERYTFDLVKRSQQFALNIPGRPLADAVVKLGSVSGHDVPDKLSLSGLTLSDAQQISSPVIEECLGWIECGLVDALDVGDHILIVGEVLAAKAEEEAFDEAWLLEEEELKPLHHLGGSLFAVLEARITAP
jgi:flavin reductase (DIM6/NTAB) family NADH-FMN oxidoreductase RutF